MKPKRFLSILIDAAMALAMVLILASAAWAGPKYKVLHAFGAGKDGAGLWGSLLLNQKGKVYGTTTAGGSFGGGIVFELTPKATGGWTETILHNFDGNDGDGSNGALVFDPTGNLYGTTSFGGAFGYGTAFELSHGRDTWTENVLFSFPQPPTGYGCCPYAGLIIDEVGNLYGTAGTAFELTLGSKGWTATVLHNFTGRHGDGSGPYAGVILDAAGNLYGTTERGGTGAAGTVYQLRHTPSGWKESVLHDFPSFHNDGQVPGVGALVSDDSGNLYGTTDQGGSNSCVDVGCGTVFKLTAGSNGHWNETILYNFAGNAKGSGPGGGVVRDGAGNLYGTTVYGGTTSCDCGVVYKLAPNSKGKWEYTVLHRFTGYDGAQPDANLILDSKGNLYGTTATGGAGGAGVAFELIP
jgi:uncharacterized repeat protein (TIGR03803 family)